MLAYGSSFLQVCDIVINFESYNLASGTEEMTNHSSSTETFSRLKGQPLKKINALEILFCNFMWKKSSKINPHVL